MNNNQAPIQLNFTDLIDALSTLEDNRDAYRAYTKAQRVVKKYVPPVEKTTVFQVGEDWQIIATPEPRDGYEVKSGTTQHRQIVRIDGE